MSKETMRILVTGSRKWADQTTVWDALSIVTGNAFRAGCHSIVVVHGCARGADMFAEEWVSMHSREDWPVRADRHPANWQRYGKAAGMRRNREMVQAGADVCLAFVLDDSRGATQCAELAEAEGIPTCWFRQYTPPEGDTNG